MGRLFLLLWCWTLGCAGSPGSAGQKAQDTPPLGILLTPEDVIVPLGATVQLSATGLYKKRRTEDLTHVAQWRTSDGSVVGVGSGLDQEGLVTGHAVGHAEVWAVVEGVKSPAAQISVTDQALDALTVEPSELVVAVGQDVPMTATAQFSDGLRSDASGQVRWVTGDSSVVTFDGALLTATGVGVTSIHAQWDDIQSAPVPVEVLATASAELRVHTLTAVGVDDTLSVTVQIENSGTVGAADFWVDVFTDPVWSLGPGDIGDDFDRVSWVGPDQTVAVEFEISGVSEGSHEVVAVVDIEDEVSETDETNNEARVDVTMTGGTHLVGPNLTVDYVGWLADPTDVYYYIEITNEGDEGVGPFWVDVYADAYFAPGVGQDGDAWEQVSWIGPWQTAVVELLVPESCWSCESWVQVDTWDEVVETDEADNLYGPEFVWY